METTALFVNTIVQLKECWEREYGDWRRRLLWEQRSPSVWAVGVYLDAGVEKEKMAFLRVVGARDER